MTKENGPEELVVGGLYRCFSGFATRQIIAIEGDTIRWRDEDGVGSSSKEMFLALQPKLVPDGALLPISSARGDKDFTVRDEANALTAFAFRNGFIEELHAGKWSPLLEQPGNCRITDDEMRCLMIDASEKLARMLNLKQRNPAQYEAEIRRYHENYCGKWKRD